MLKRLNLFLFVLLLLSSVKTFAAGYIFDLEEGLLKGSPKAPQLFKGKPVRYIISNYPLEVGLTTDLFAQIHPGCQKPIKDVIASVNQRFPMIQDIPEVRSDSHILPILLNNLGDMSAADLCVIFAKYIENPSLLMERGMDPNVLEARISAIKAYGASRRGLLDVYLAAIIYNTPQAEFQQYIDMAGEKAKQLKVSGPHILNNAKARIAEYFPEQIDSYYNKKGKLIGRTIDLYY